MIWHQENEFDQWDGRISVLAIFNQSENISVIFWLVNIVQSDSCVNSQSNLIGAKSCDLIGRKSSPFIGCWESILIG